MQHLDPVCIQVWAEIWPFTAASGISSPTSHVPQCVLVCWGGIGILAASKSWLSCSQILSVLQDVCYLAIHSPSPHLPLSSFVLLSIWPNSSKILIPISISKPYVSRKLTGHTDNASKFSVSQFDIPLSDLNPFSWASAPHFSVPAVKC